MNIKIFCVLFSICLCLPYKRSEADGLAGHRFEEVSSLFANGNPSRRSVQPFLRKRHHLRRVGPEVIPAEMVSERLIAKEVKRHLVRQNKRRIRVIPTRILRKYQNIMANLPLLLDN